MSFKTLLLFTALVWAAAPGNAQTSAQSFTFAAQTAGSSAAPLPNGGTIQLPIVAVGSSSAATFIITSTNPAQYTVTTAAVTGAGFATGGKGTPVPAGGTAAFLITFTPTAAGSFPGTLALTLTGPSGDTISANFNLAAAAVNGVLISYVVSPNGNQTLIADGGTLAFPQTQVNATAAATFLINNRTSTPVTLNSALILGSAYQLSGVPLLPANIAAGSVLSITLTFTPTAAGPESGALTLTINGAPQTFSLTGQGASVSLSYQFGAGSSSTAVSPNGIIPLGSALANSAQTQTTVTVTNAGNLSAAISGISVSSTNFVLSSLPAFPAALAPGGSFSFKIAFVPQSVGNLTATLAIGNSTFQLTGTGLGPNFTVTLMVGSQNTVIAPGATGVLPNTSVGNKLTFTLQVANTGNQTGTITALSLAGTSVSIVQPPTLPVTIAPAGTLTINAVFAPTSTGIVNIAFQVQDQSYGLRVVGDPPPALPPVTFNNVTSQMTPLQQPALGLTLSTPYPFALTGVLSIAFAADILGDDPNVQFIAGARFVAFSIPANSTQAMFGTGKAASTSAPFQTGTTAGIITLSATFALGTYDVTGGVPVTQSITIPESVPVINSVKIAAESSTSLTLLIVGYSTPRSLDTLVFQFTPAPGAALATTTLTTNVAPAFNTWFNSMTGVSFGSQFSVSVQLDVNGTLSAIASVDVSASNSQGTSLPATISLN